MDDIQLSNERFFGMERTDDKMVSENNSWVPPYGLGNPLSVLETNNYKNYSDSDSFLYGSSNSIHLETIQEENSDDLHSESEVSDLGDSPLEWLDIISGTGSILCVNDANKINCDADCNSMHEPKKNRFEIHNLPHDDERMSISRSSSLLQFETFEKQCQETSARSSPSMLSQFNTNALALEIHRKNNTAAVQEFCNELLEQSKISNLKTWHSFENLSEDSGYSDYMCNKTGSIFTKGKCSTFNSERMNVGNAKLFEGGEIDEISVAQNIGFSAYDCKLAPTNFNYSYGTSFHDLSKLDVNTHYEIMETKVRIPQLQNLHKLCRWNSDSNLCSNLHIEDSSLKKSASEPNLYHKLHDAKDKERKYCNHTDNYNANVLNVSRKLICDNNLSPSVDMNQSIAVKNWDLGDFVNTIDSSTAKKTIASSIARNENFKSISTSNYNSEYYLKCTPSKVLKSIETAHVTNTSKIRYSRDFNDNDVENHLLTDKGFEQIYVRNSGKRKRHHRPPLEVELENKIQDIDEKSSSVEKVQKLTNEINENHMQTFFGSQMNDSGTTNNVIRNDPVWVYRDQVDTGSSVLYPTDMNTLYGKCALHTFSTFNNNNDIIKTQSFEDHSFCIRQRNLNVYDDTIGSCVSPTDRYSESHVLKSSGTTTKNTRSRNFRDALSVSGNNNSICANSVKISRKQRISKCSFQDGIVMGGDPMVSSSTTTSKSKPGVGKFSGLFSRLTSFRFAPKKKKCDDENSKSHQIDTSISYADSSTYATRIANKDDYIYIPLKKSTEISAERSRNRDVVTSPSTSDHHQIHTSNARQNITSKSSYYQYPGENEKTDNEFINWKPPLPRAPPRVVGASVKKDMECTAKGGKVIYEDGFRTIDPSSKNAHYKPMQPIGLIETDLDTDVTVIKSDNEVKTRSLLNLNSKPHLCLPNYEYAVQDATELENTSGNICGKHSSTVRPHKSMEFLLDKQNVKVIEPPENELKKGSERILSEHELRIQRSLKKLNVPEWYKKSPQYQESFLLRKHSNRDHWSDYSSRNRTTSLSSLSQRNEAQSLSIYNPSYSNQNSFVRWSTTKLSSTVSSPCASTRSSFNVRHYNGSVSPMSVRSSFRQPYLGWRSQERLAKPRTPAERLANTLLPQISNTPQNGNSEIQTSIKEVTSAIVDYVSTRHPDENFKECNSLDSDFIVEEPHVNITNSRENQKCRWLESSFVGVKVSESPSIPISSSNSTCVSGVEKYDSLQTETQNHNELRVQQEVTILSGSTTMEDVLDSLLGLHSSRKTNSTNPKSTVIGNR